MRMPKNPIAVVALARMLNERGDKTAARARFEQALPALKDDADREQVLRTLLGLCLDLKDYDAGKRYHLELVKRAGGSFFVRAEFGRELLARGAYERAAAEYKTVVQAATGDNRVLAPALRDYGKALDKLGKREEALTQYRRALSLAGESGVRREIVAAIVDSYRQRDRLPELIAEMEKPAECAGRRSAHSGRAVRRNRPVDKALTTYRRALAADGKDLATRLKVVHLLEVRGDLEQAIAEYDALIKAAPRNPDFVFQLAEALISRGDRKKALARLQELEARSQSDEETLAALVDFYERVDEKERALALLQRLAGSTAADPEHLVELGTRYWQEGDKKKALATWQRIKAIVPDRSRALQILGELYLEHDMPKEALAALAEAAKLSPKQPRYRKAYALALERTSAASGTREGKSAQFEEARKIWEELIREAQSDATLAREARQHIITPVQPGGTTRAACARLGAPVGAKSARLGGRAAARRSAFAAATLLGSGASARARDRRCAGRCGELELFGARVGARAQAARCHQRAGKNSRRAIRSARANTSSAWPATPPSCTKTTKRCATPRAPSSSAQTTPRATRSSARCIGNARTLPNRSVSSGKRSARTSACFTVYLELAELLLGQGEADDADMLLRRVIRASPDEELISQAARLSMQVNLGRGTLESLERDLLPLALNSPERPIYRQLLLEVYGALAYPLLEREKSDRPKDAEAARIALDRLGERAVKPLLDALGDAREAEQEVAITLLSHVQNKSAGATPVFVCHGQR